MDSGFFMQNKPNWPGREMGAALAANLRPVVVTERGSVHDRLHHGGLEVAVDLAADGGLDHEDGDELLFRIDREMGAEALSQPKLPSERYVPAAMESWTTSTVKPKPMPLGRPLWPSNMSPTWLEA